MNRILAILAGVLLCASAQAVDIPSEASGDYVGNGWACRVLAFATTQAPDTHRTLEFQCVGPDNRQRIGAPVSLGCPGAAVVPLYAQPGTPTAVRNLTISSYTPGAMLVFIDGATVGLLRVQPVASPAPYSGCGASAPKPASTPGGAYCARYSCD